MSQAAVRLNEVEYLHCSSLMQRRYRNLRATVLAKMKSGDVGIAAIMSHMRKSGDALPVTG